ncbi:hypothetical protein DFJ73DRAFT_762771 [Zopfochytrium polystomum]|nr:hypothetical protein DFJ73DRAFT_762771 [Zopfochytrium polystomum]
MTATISAAASTLLAALIVALVVLPAADPLLTAQYPLRITDRGWTPRASAADDANAAAAVFGRAAVVVVAEIGAAIVTAVAVGSAAGMRYAELDDGARGGGVVCAPLVGVADAAVATFNCLYIVGAVISGVDRAV